ncbi:tape measure protein [Acinetobacter schindleri]|uniref:tape measure protein n=1 Tax=Acinetobacter schindleri TaxID=108981 RepID=UPI0032B4778F
MAGKLGVLTLDLVARIGKFVEPIKNASRTTEREMQRASNSVNIMNGMLGKLAATAGTVFSINQIKNYADSYTGIVNQLKLVTNGQAELNTAMNDTYKIAQATASSWGAVNTVYSKYMSNAKVLNLTQAETARLTEVTSKAVSISGSTTEAAAGALFQFGQALDGNILRAEEYNSLVDGAGGLLNAMAKGLGVTRGELRQMMLDGKLSGQVITEALLKAGDSVDELYSKTDTTIAASFNLITTEVTKMVGEFDSATGASKTFVQGITLLSQNMDALVDVTMVAGAYWAGTYIPVLVKGTQATIADTAGKVSNALATRSKALADYDVAKSNLAATAAMVRSMGVTNAQTTAMMANARAAYQQAAASRAAAVAGTGALGLLGGPVGIGVTLAAVAAGYLLMRDSTEESTKSLRENNESVDDAIKKYNELDEVRRRSQLVSEREKLRDLGQEYEDINSKLITATYSFSRHNDMTSEQSKQVNALIAEYKKTGDIDQFSGKINALNFINQTGKDKFNTLAGSVKTAGNEFKTQKTFVSQMEPALKGVGDQAKQTAVETTNLSVELRKLLNINTENSFKSNYLNESVKRGVDPKLAEMLYEARKASGLIGSGKKLSDDVLKSVFNRWKADQGLNKTLEDRAKIEERNKKLVEAQGNAMKVNALVASNAAKANYAALESAKGLPKGLLSAVNMTESPNSNTARSGAGARGAFQFMPRTAERFDVDVNSVNSSAKGAAEYLDKLLKMFEGNLENALRAYNWGEGNMQNYLKYGSGMKDGQKGYFADRPMPRETREYSGKVMSYMGGASGISFTEEYSFDDWLKEQEQFVMEREKREKEMVETQLSIQAQYHDEWQALEFDNQEKIKEIEKAFAADPTERDRLLGLQQKAYEDDVANWIKAQDERVKAENEANQQILIDRYKFLNDSVAMYERIAGLSSGADEIFARATMSPEGYGRWSLANDRSNSQAALKKERVGVEQDIMTSNLYSTDDERYEALKEAHQQYRDGLAAIDVKYYQGLEDLQNQTQAASLAGYGAMFGMMGSMLDAYGAKESTAYKVAFAMQKGFVLSSAILNAKGAIMSAWNDPSNVTMWQKIAGAAAVAVQTNDLMSAIQGVALSGMAHDGIDNIPKEGTWLLDKGERVVDSRTNADLKGMIANQKNGGGNVEINVHVTDSGVTTQSNQSDQKQLGQMIGNAVRAVIRQEQRQGGLLAK